MFVIGAVSAVALRRSHSACGETVSVELETSRLFAVAYERSVFCVVFCFFGLDACLEQTLALDRLIFALLYTQGVKPRYKAVVTVARSMLGCFASLVFFVLSGLTFAVLNFSCPGFESENVSAFVFDFPDLLFGRGLLELYIRLVLFYENNRIRNKTKQNSDNKNYFGPH